MTPPRHSVVERQLEAFSRLKRAILQEYSYWNRRHVDWEPRFTRFEPKLRLVRTARQFAEDVAGLLRVAEDIHLWLRVGTQTIPTYRRCVPTNVVPRTLMRVVPRWREDNAVVSSGQFADGICYLFLRAWPGDSPGRLQAAYRVLRQAAGTGSPLLIDVRANGGGAEPLAARFAGCFVRHPVCYAKHLTRRRGEFLGPMERWLKPNKTGLRFRGRVAVLIGPGTVSSCESFALMMKQIPGCKLVGQRTAGASGNPKPIDLGNGVILYVPSWKDLALDGTCLEGRGVTPDMEVEAKPEAFVDQDPVLAAALKFLRR